MLRDQLEQRGTRILTRVLAKVADASPISEADAVRLLEPFEVLLAVVGDGVRLTGAGYLPPAVVEQVAERTGATGWWIGKANREDLTWPVAQLRATARALGLVSVRKGVLVPTGVARRNRARPLELLRHVATRLPLGRTDFDRQAGWMTLAVAATGAPSQDWDDEIRILLLSLGWRLRGATVIDSISVTNPTLDALGVLGGRLRSGIWRADVSDADPALAATAGLALASEPN